MPYRYKMCIEKSFIIIHSHMHTHTHDSECVLSSGLSFGLHCIIIVLVINRICLIFWKPDQLWGTVSRKSAVLNSKRKLFEFD